MSENIYKTKFKVRQKVWIIKGEYYDGDEINDDAITDGLTLRDLFEEVEVQRIVISRLRDSRTRGCGIPDKNPIVVVYEFCRWYVYSNNYLEKNVFETLDAAMKAYKKRFNQAKKQYQEDQENERAEERECIKRDAERLGMRLEDGD